MYSFFEFRPKIKKKNTQPTVKGERMVCRSAPRYVLRVGLHRSSTVFCGVFCVWFLVNVVSLTFFCLGLDVVHQIIFYVFIFEKRPDNSTGRVLES